MRRQSLADRVVALVEEARRKVADGNVQQKRKAAIEWCKRVNALEAGDRLERRWAYLLVTDNDFYQCWDCAGDNLARYMRTHARGGFAIIPDIRRKRDR